MGAFAVERSYAVMTGGSLVACSTGTVIYVFTAVVPRPAIHTHTLVAAVDVVTRAAILAGVGHQLAFINILCAQLTCWRTRAQKIKVKLVCIPKNSSDNKFSFLTKKEQ